MLEKKDIEMSIALCYAHRALGKTSNGEVFYTIEDMKKWMPKEKYQEYNLHNASLHYHEPLERFINEEESKLPMELRDMIGGSYPKIEYLIKKYEELKTL